MTASPMLAAYRVATALVGGFAPAWLAARTRNGKEDPTRLQERFGRYSRPRPGGAVLWLHAASVGESAVAMTLVEALAARDHALSFVLTTGTRTSADVVARRELARLTHVYAPLDRIDCVRRFLDHWRPDAGVFVESEVWPNLLLEARTRALPLALVNARMSPATLRRWTSWRTAARTLFGIFAFVSAADSRSVSALAELRGKPVDVSGSLKLAAPSLPVDQQARAMLEAEIGARPVWLAASTHAGEDEIALEAHELLRRERPDALLIIAPRHPDRGAAIAARARGAPRRSEGAKIGAAPVYVADTLGELGLLYEIAPVALVAGSLLPHLKGHNPVEPANHGAAILSGPYVESFDDLFEALLSADGARVVRNVEDIAAEVAALWSDESKRMRLVTSARTITERGAEAFAKTVEGLLSLRAANAKGDAADAPA
ncbi:MAG: 3-deoxy-D-manno-octulosonic acid transferase [Hyphomonadaceae bacterium]|nr:3-deoxy-D-manno-octulosonic acid transferase [Hyphomonadaceae bacterium]